MKSKLSALVAAWGTEDLHGRDRVLVGRQGTASINAARA
jgi:hypothetical protein